MANTRRGNLHYVDSTGVLSSESVKISSIILTPTSAGGVIIFQDPLNNDIILNLQAATSGESLIVDLGTLSLPNGLKVSTLTNAVAMILYSGTK